MGKFSRTADGACPVELPDGDAAYVKPRPSGASPLLVAREKIASDLGYLLDLPVAPVVVRLPEGSAWPHYTSLSLAILPDARQWGAGGALLMPGVARRLEELRVFWTWIGDADHNAHPGNVLYAVKSGTCSVLAIDHSWCLCHGNHSDPLAVGVCRGYGTAGMDGSRAWAQAMIVKILALDWAKVENVVQRLHPILTVEERGRIVKILEARRDHLVAFLGL